MKYTLLLMLSILTSPFYSQSNVLDKVVGLVNDQMILLSDIQTQKISEKDSCISDCEVLKKLVIEKMLLAKAIKDSITVTEEEVNNDMERRMNYFISAFGSQEKMEKYYGKTITELKVSFREDIENKLRAERTKAKLFSGSQPSPKEIQTFFDAIPKSEIPYYNSEVQMAQIVFYPKISRDNKRLAKEKALKILKSLLTKESDMATQAILYSDDQGSAANGGDLGWIKGGEMVPEFEQAAFTTPVGTISELVETKYGYHIIQVLDKKNEKARVRHILISPKSDDADFTTTLALADSISKKIKGGRLNFEKAVETYSDDEIFKSNGGIIVNFRSPSRSSIIEIGEVDPSLTEVVNKMNVGDISAPIPYSSPSGKVGYRVIKLLKETSPHKSSLETDYAKIKEMAMEKHRNQATENWFNTFKHLVFIKIDPEYKKCTELQNLFN
jgi:peptidyl-prolyl cis-trans isomerase SurA